MSDSLMLETTGEGVERLAKALELCTDWKDDPAEFRAWGNHDAGLCFLRHEGNMFPSPINARQAAEMAFAFLEKIPREKWPQKPDIDGHCNKGWKVRHSWEGTTVLPFWMIYHK
ncbi:hypothetical protein [uncultured Roseibium sp.]|uniref:hypothetical protein n=1 Tax=uncultured Roseibium sp. TaxID=1936171 RepID=UPI0026119496|nr:hypothetical protein [uncultured Roseibium sp.]